MHRKINKNNIMKDDFKFNFISNTKIKNGIVIPPSLRGFVHVNGLL
jgi:hypothetical protein